MDNTENRNSIISTIAIVALCGTGCSALTAPHFDEQSAAQALGQRRWDNAVKVAEIALSKGYRPLPIIGIAETVSKLTHCHDAWPEKCAAITHPGFPNESCNGPVLAGMDAQLSDCNESAIGIMQLDWGTQQQTLERFRNAGNALQFEDNVRLALSNELVSKTLPKSAGNYTEVEVFRNGVSIGVRHGHDYRAAFATAQDWVNSLTLPTDLYAAWAPAYAEWLEYLTYFYTGCRGDCESTKTKFHHGMVTAATEFAALDQAPTNASPTNAAPSVAMETAPGQNAADTYFYNLNTPGACDVDATLSEDQAWYPLDKETHNLVTGVGDTVLSELVFTSSLWGQDDIDFVKLDVSDLWGGVSGSHFNPDIRVEATVAGSDPAIAVPLKLELRYECTSETAASFMTCADGIPEDGGCNASDEMPHVVEGRADCRSGFWGTSRDSGTVMIRVQATSNVCLAYRLDITVQ